MPAAQMTAVHPVAPPVRYIHARLLRYHPCVVDLRHRRAVHSCDVCPWYRIGPGLSAPGRAGPVLSQQRCGAVHYGICLPAVRPGDTSSGVVKDVTAGRQVIEVRSSSPPPPPLPAKRRINVPIIVQPKQPSQVTP